MKSHYEETAQDRNFEPGYKVPALLPIPGRPLQLRYYGPYTVDKTLSDVNYIVNCSERRKQNSYVKLICLRSTLIGIVLLFHQ